MIRFFTLLLALLSVPLTAQTIIVPVPFADSNGDGRVDFGSANRKAYGVPYVLLQRQTDAGWVYCGPAGCPAAKLADPATPLPPVVTSPARDYGSSGQIAYGSISNVRATRTMDAFPLSRGPATISDVILDRGRQFATPAKGAWLTVNDVTLERFTANVTKRGVFVRGDSARWTIRDFDIRYVGSTDTNDYPMAIQLGMDAKETVHDVLIERGYIGGFRNSRPAAYPNADGIDCERGVRNVTIRNVVIDDVTDGAIDCKATNVRLENVTARNVGKRSYRLWGTGTASTLTSVNPGWAHIWISGNGASFVIDKLVAIGGGMLVQSEEGAKLVVKECDLSGWTGKVRSSGGGAVTFGQGC